MSSITCSPIRPRLVYQNDIERDSPFQLILKFDAVMSTAKEEELGPYSFDLDNHEGYKRKSRKKARKNLTLEIPMREVPPVVDAKGEFTEVQVLEEGKIFDPDQFLDELDKHEQIGRSHA